MIDLGTLERIAGSKDFAIIAFLLFIFILAGVVWYLWRRNEYLHEKIELLLEARSRAYAETILMRNMHERPYMEDKSPAAGTPHGKVPSGNKSETA